LKHIIRALPILALAGCGASPDSGIADAQQRYLAAKATCDAEYPRGLALQADCRTRAANTFIRPYYRYGDLMTFAQEQRKALAVKVDRHEMTRKDYDRQIALSEREVSGEEDRRNRLAHTASSYEATPFAAMLESINRVFR
jgi:hypothetical protein